MKELPFKLSYGRVDEETYNAKKLGLKEELDITGEELKKVLLPKLKGAGFVAVCERNFISQNINPFDLAVGDEETLGLIGIEIKGDTDNYSRLNGQLSSYLFACDGMYLALHKKNVPEMLPDYVGVLRVFADGDVFMEKSSYMRQELDISSDYEWDAIFKNCGLSHPRVIKALHLVQEVRRNILFNRFFAVPDGYNTKKFEKFYPLTEAQRKIAIGFDVPSHLQMLQKEARELQKNVEMLNQIINVGQTSLFDKKQSNLVDKKRK